MKILDFIYIVFFLIFIFWLSNLHRNRIENNQQILNQKLDSILIIQKELYNIDSMYLKATRVHMGQCAFVLKEGILTDINN